MRVESFHVLRVKFNGDHKEKFEIFEFSIRLFALYTLLPTVWVPHRLFVDAAASGEMLWWWANCSHRKQQVHIEKSEEMGVSKPKRVGGCTENENWNKWENFVLDFHPLLVSTCLSLHFQSKTEEFFLLLLMKNKIFCSKLVYSACSKGLRWLKTEISCRKEKKLFTHRKLRMSRAILLLLWMLRYERRSKVYGEKCIQSWHDK